MRTILMLLEELYKITGLAVYFSVLQGLLFRVVTTNKGPKALIVDKAQ